MNNEAEPRAQAQPIPFNEAELELDPATNREHQRLVDAANGDLMLLQLHQVLFDMQAGKVMSQVSFDRQIALREALETQIAYRRRDLGLL